MDLRHFDATAIGTASAIGSLVTLPLPLLVGWLADRMNRKPILFVCFLAPALGLLTLASAVDLPHFWLSSILSTFVGTGTVAGSALIMELFPQDQLSTPLALLNATPWTGIVIGLSAGGLAIHVLHMMPALFLMTLPSLVAIFLLTRIQEESSQYQTETG